MGRKLRPQKFFRMRIEGDYGRSAVSGASVLGRSGNDSLMAEMNAIENSDGEKDRTRQALEIGNRMQNFHVQIVALSAAHSRDFRQREDRPDNLFRRHSFDRIHRNRIRHIEPA